MASVGRMTQFTGGVHGLRCPTGAPWHRLCAASGCVLASAPSSPAASGRRATPPTDQPPPPPFRATTDPRAVDVSVLDKNRKWSAAWRRRISRCSKMASAGLATSAPSTSRTPVPSAKWMNHAPLDVQTRDAGRPRSDLSRRASRPRSVRGEGTKEAAHAIVDQLAEGRGVGRLHARSSGRSGSTDRARLPCRDDTFAPSQPVAVAARRAV